MRANIHRVSLAPVATEQDLIIRQAQVNKKLQEKAINVAHITDDDLQVLGEFVNMSLKEVMVDPATQIFNHRASKADMIKGRQDMSSTCSLCSSEYNKKNKMVQCEFCARNCCSQCCFKSRLDPESKNPTVAEKLLICQDCQDKYRNIMLNSDFRKQHIVISRLKDQLINEVSKIQEKSTNEKTRLENLKPKQDPQVAWNRTMKLAKLKKDITNSKKQSEKLAKDIANQKSGTHKLEMKLKQKEAEVLQKKLILEKVKRQQQQEVRRQQEIKQNQLKAKKAEEFTKQLIRQREEEVKISQKAVESQVSKEVKQSTNEMDSVEPVATIIDKTHQAQTSIVEQLKTESSDLPKVQVSNIQEVKLNSQNQASTKPNMQRIPIAPGEQVILIQPVKLSQGQKAKQVIIPVVEVKQESVPQKVAESKKHQVQAPKPLPLLVEQKSDIPKQVTNIEQIKSQIINQGSKYEKSKANLIETQPQTIVNSQQKDKQEKQPTDQSIRKKSIQVKPEVIQKNDKVIQKKVQKIAQTPNAKHSSVSSQQVSRTHSQSGIVKQPLQNHSKILNRPSSVIMTEEDLTEDAMMSKSLIVEPENKLESKQTVRKSSKNMTEKEILSLKIPPPSKASKLFKAEDAVDIRERVSSRGKLNSSASVKQSVVQEPKASLVTQKQLTKEQILRKSRNEDLEQSQTPGIDQKSKCGCLLF